MSSYARPLDSTPFVLAFCAVLIALWLLGFDRIFFRRGAEFLIVHPGLLRCDPQSPTMIRVGYCVMGGMVGLVLAALKDVPSFKR
jgi:hypothetical protein